MLQIPWGSEVRLYERAHSFTQYQLGCLPSETISLAPGLVFTASNRGHICFLQLYCCVYDLNHPKLLFRIFWPIFCSLSPFFSLLFSLSFFFFFSWRKRLLKVFMVIDTGCRVFLNVGNIPSNYTVQTWRLYYLKLPGMMSIYQTSCKKFISAVKQSLLSLLACFI